MKNILKQVNLLLFSILVVSACMPSTQITGSWKAPAADANYDNVLVAALVNDLETQREMETELVQELRKKGVNAEKSIDVLDPNFVQQNINDKQAIMDKIKGNNHDAILTVALVDKDTDAEYVPGTTVYSPLTTYGYYGDFWGYYSYRYPQLYDPGYYTLEKTYFLESNMYDLSNEELVWSAQAESVEPGTVENFSEEVADVTVKELNQDQLL